MRWRVAAAKKGASRNARSHHREVTREPFVLGFDHSAFARAECLPNRVASKLDPTVICARLDGQLQVADTGLFVSWNAFRVKGVSILGVDELM